MNKNVSTFDEELMAATAEEITEGLNKAIKAFGQAFEESTGIEISKDKAIEYAMQFALKRGRFGSRYAGSRPIISKYIPILLEEKDNSFTYKIRRYHNNKVTDLVEKAGKLLK